MPNPRYIGPNNEVTQELLSKMNIAKQVYFENLDHYCEKKGFDWAISDMKNIQYVFLIGSHAEETGWMNETSDLDIKLVLPDALPMLCHNFKKDVLNPKLCPQDSEKRRWIDLYFVREKYQVDAPMYDLTKEWHEL